MVWIKQKSLFTPFYEITLKLQWFLCVCVKMSLCSSVYIHPCRKMYKYINVLTCICTSIYSLITKEIWNIWLGHMHSTHFLAGPPLFFDHRPVTKISWNTTKFSKEAWHTFIPGTVSKGCFIPFWQQRWLVPHQWGRSGLGNVSLCHHVHGIIKPHVTTYNLEGPSPL